MRNLIRAATLVAATALAGMCTIGGASAQEPTAPHVTGAPSASEIQKAEIAANSPEGRQVMDQLLDQFGPQTPAPSANAVRHSVPVYTLTREFVEGKAGAAVADLAHVAVPVRTEDGKAVTQFATRGTDGTWSVERASTGDLEATLAAQLPEGTTLLHEPQINAWYALGGESLHVLRDSVHPDAVGTDIALSDYQQRVHADYGDKLPGSDYDRSGAGGGYASTQEPSSMGWAPLTLGGLVLTALLVFAALRPSRMAGRQE